MTKLSKGQATRNMIVERSRLIFNEKGLDITLDTIAQEMGQTKGRITNHFPTKDSLFQAIMGYYEWQLGEYMRHFDWSSKVPGMEMIARLISGVMDIQYENRCAIGYLALITADRTDLHAYIQHNYKRNLLSIRNRLSSLVEGGVLVPDILQKKVFPVFVFQYVTLLTNWVISEQHYGTEIGYEKMKPVYLQGIMHCYVPFLTAKGKQQFDALNFSRISKDS